MLSWAEADLAGAQISAVVSTARGPLAGAQIAGVMSWAASLKGAQVALVDVAGDTAGAQVGTVSWATSLKGAQAALLNVSGDTAGLQAGVVNVARRMAGVQLGALNVAEEMTGVPLGLVNVIRDGQIHLELYGSDLQPVNVAFKSGSRNVYTTLVVGGGRQGHALYGAGVGLHLGDRFWLDTDLLSTSTLELQFPLTHANIGAHLRAIGGVQVGPVGLFAGLSLNALVPLRDDVAQSGSYVPPMAQVGPVLYWPGGLAGVRL
jgi:hypothetical protein